MQSGVEAAKPKEILTADALPPIKGEMGSTEHMVSVFDRENMASSAVRERDDQNYEILDNLMSAEGLEFPEEAPSSRLRYMGDARRSIMDSAQKLFEHQKDFLSPDQLEQCQGFASKIKDITDSLVHETSKNRSADKGKMVATAKSLVNFLAGVSRERNYGKELRDLHAVEKERNDAVIADSKARYAELNRPQEDSVTLDDKEEVRLERESKAEGLLPADEKGDLADGLDLAGDIQAKSSKEAVSRTVDGLDLAGQTGKQSSKDSIDILTNTSQSDTASSIDGIESGLETDEDRKEQSLPSDTSSITLDDDNQSTSRTSLSSEQFKPTIKPERSTAPKDSVAAIFEENKELVSDLGERIDSSLDDGALKNKLKGFLEKAGNLLDSFIKKADKEDGNMDIQLALKGGSVTGSLSTLDRVLSDLESGKSADTAQLSKASEIISKRLEGITPNI